MPIDTATIGVAISAKNEAHFIKRCIQSVGFAHEVLVVDSMSTDGTAELAKSLGALVIVREDVGIRNQKQFVLEQMKTEWILALDPDEWLTPEAQAEIQDLIKTNPVQEGFSIPRYHLFMGSVIRHGRGVDHPLRLVRRGCGEYTPHLPHEHIKVNGASGALRHGMIHDSTPTINKRILKILKESDLDLSHFDGKRPSFKEIFINPLIYFLSITIKKGGWRDGLPGLILTALFSAQIFIVQAKWFEAFYLGRNKKNQ